MNITQALNFAKQAFLDNKNNQPCSHSAQIDAEYLLVSVINKNATWLKTWPESELTQQQQQQYEALVKRRVNGEPIAYITGSKGFWDLELNTNQSTLIPRSETERLVETAIDVLTFQSQPQPQPRPKPLQILDLGTGTGAIALALGHELKEANIIGVDFNPQAVLLAQSNAVKNKINNVKFFQSNWFQQISYQAFDLIVSNPPYIEENDPHLNQGDLVFEPSTALIAKDNGLADIKQIMLQAQDYLKSGATLMFEHGYQQGQEVRAWFQHYGYQQIKTIKDHGDNDRVSLAIWQN